MTRMRTGSRSRGTASCGGVRARIGEPLAVHQLTRGPHPTPGGPCPDRYCSILPTQVLQGHRLGEHLVHLHPLPAGSRAAFEGEADLAGRGRLHDDGHRRHAGQVAHLLAEHEPRVVVLHHEVRQDDVGSELPGLREALVDRVRRLDRVSALLQERLLPRQEIRVVVNDEYSSQVRPPSTDALSLRRRCVPSIRHRRCIRGGHNRRMRTVKQAPPSGLFDAWMVPPCIFTMP